MRSIVTINLLILGSLLISPVAFAHKAEVKRSIMFEAWERELHYVARIKVPARLRASLEMQAKTPVELKRVLAKRALSDLKISLNKVQVRLDKFEGKLNLPENPQDAVHFMLYGKIELPIKETRISLRLGKSAEDITVEVLKGMRPPKRLPITKSSGQAFKRILKKSKKVVWVHGQKQK